MSAYLRTAVLLLSVLGLAACAAMDPKSGAAFVAPPRAGSILDSDQAYVAAVERIARRRGIEVVWIHVPRKRVVSQDD